MGRYFEEICAQWLPKNAQSILGLNLRTGSFTSKIEAYAKESDSLFLVGLNQLC